MNKWDAYGDDSEWHEKKDLLQLPLLMQVSFFSKIVFTKSTALDVIYALVTSSCSLWEATACWTAEWTPDQPACARPQGDWLAHLQTSKQAHTGLSKRHGEKIASNVM